MGLAGTTGIWFAQTHLDLELDIAYGHSSNPNFHGQQVSSGASLIWAEATWRLGASVGNHFVDKSGPDPQASNYHVYGVWFPSGSLTLQAKGGRFWGNTDGNYRGAAVNWYVTPDFALFAAYERANYDQGMDESIWSAAAQYLPWETVPLSFVAGYSTSDFSFYGNGQTHANTTFVSLRFFFNRSGLRTLVGRERTGPIGWPAAFNFQAISFRR